MPSLTPLVLPMWTMLSPWWKQSHGWFCQGCKATNHTGTLRNLLNPAPGTYTNTRQNSPEPSGTFQDLPETNLSEPSGAHLRTPELFGTFRNLPPECAGTLRNLPEPASGTYTSTHRISPKPSGTRLRHLHQHRPELSGTFRNRPPEPAPATRTGTHRSLSGLKTPLAYAVGEKQHRHPSRNPKRTRKSWWNRSLSGQKKEEKGKETNPGTLTGTRRNQEIMMEQNPNNLRASGAERSKIRGPRGEMTGVQPFFSCLFPAWASHLPPKSRRTKLNPYHSPSNVSSTLFFFSSFFFFLLFFLVFFPLLLPLLLTPSVCTLLVLLLVSPGCAHWVSSPRRFSGGGEVLLG